jgi:hypothetical protein
LFLELALGGAAAVLFPAGLLWVCDRLGWLSLESVFSVAVSPVFLIASGVLAVLAFRIPRSKTPDRTDYSALDRILHRVPLYGAQASLADLSELMFKGRRVLTALHTTTDANLGGTPR